MMAKNLRDFPLQYIKGVGPERAKLLSRIGIKNIKDALYFLPYRYEDRSNIKKICDLTYGNLETVSGTIISAELIKTHKKKFHIFELLINDGSSILKAKWFNQPYMKKIFKKGEKVILCGIVKRDSYYGTGFEMHNPEHEIFSDNGETHIHLNRIVPIYSVTKGLGVRQMRTIIFNVLETYLNDIEDVIPEDILKRNGLRRLNECLYNIHFPEKGSDIDSLNKGISEYHRRISFDELFMLQLGLAILNKRKIIEKGISFEPDGRLLKKLFHKLPFKLTKAQERVFNEILIDMKKPHPMNRLIQGDVGCGKTIIALMAMLTATECGYQSALMAPTEILAEQHYLNICRLVDGLGIRVCLLTSGVKDKPLDMISNGQANIVVGTHALIQEGIKFKKLGLAVIDEQHRFGVMQRALLRKKAYNPDVLVMTATPIPRTLALTLYGDLDYSIIDELPPNRMPVKTIVFRESEKKAVYNLIYNETKRGRQVYVVYPVIEESEKTDLRSATLGKEAFEKIFPYLKTGLIHGRMKPQEREEIMSAFKNGDIDILVSTTVIEVGVDVPNATLMIIIHAERFGLSQLHQLRGRIGRGPHQSYCVLLAYEPIGEEALRRLKIMEKSSDGFKIAEEDLDIRGPGEFFGTRQSGLPDLKSANIIRDYQLLKTARHEAFKLIETDPEIQNYPSLRKSLETFWKGKLELFKTA